MAAKNVKQTLEPITQPEAIALDIDLESAIADELLDNIDWAKVRSALIRKAKQKFIEMLFSANDRPINISPYPELAALPSHDDDRESAA